MTIAPLSDSSAILVYAGASGLVWVIAEGNRWTRTGTLDSRPIVAAHPRFRIRPSGGLRLLWTESDWVHVSFYRDGIWDRGDSLKCEHPAGQTFISAWCDASRDTADRPILTWSDLGTSVNRDVGCVAFPHDSGWSTGNEIEGYTHRSIDLTITRDRNGDAWSAWWVIAGFGVYYNHTYVSATWWPRGTGLSLSLRGANPAREAIELSVAGAQAGPLDVRLYDLQGRLVHRWRGQALGSGLDSVRFDPGVGSTGITSGVYFARVTDSGGRGSPAVKLVFLR